MSAVLSAVGQAVAAGRPCGADSDLSQRAPTGPGASGQNQTDGTLGWARGPLEDGEPTIAGVVVNDAFAPLAVIPMSPHQASGRMQSGTPVVILPVDVAESGQEPVQALSREFAARLTKGSVDHRPTLI